MCYMVFLSPCFGFPAFYFHSLEKAHSPNRVGNSKDCEIMHTMHMTGDRTTNQNQASLFT